jgi:hypothetical protein
MARNRGKNPARHLASPKASAAMAQVGVAVMIDTAYTDELYVKVAGSTDKPFGILEEVATAVGKVIRICTQGETLCCANGAFAIGDKLKSAAATGKLDSTSAGTYAIGTATETATAQNDMCGIMVDIHIHET